MKKLFSSLPADVKQTLSSLAVAVALLCGSLFMLSSYIDSIRTDEDAPTAATPVEESSVAPDESYLSCIILSYFSPNYKS